MELKERRKFSAPGPTLKVCTLCGEEKPLNRKHFYPRKANKSGYQPCCIPCTLEEQRAKLVRLPKDAFAVSKTTMEAAKKGCPASRAVLKRQGVTAIWNGREMVML